MIKVSKVERGVQVSNTQSTVCRALLERNTMRIFPWIALLENTAL